MSAYYQAKISYQKVDQKDKVIKVTEVYLVDAVSHTDAEAKVYAAVASGRPDFKLASLTKPKIQEIFTVESGAETWFKVKVSFVSFDEKAQKEKRTPFNMLINAETPVEACNLLTERLGTVEDYQITDVTTTKILDIILN